MQEQLTVEIPLWRADQVVARALIDASDLSLVDHFRWGLLSVTPKHRYAVRWQSIGARRTRHVLMHRVLMGLERGRTPEVDHINHDTLDNRRRNLRVVSHAGNMQNRQYSTGGDYVEWVAGKRIWRARVVRNGHRVSIGRFREPDAARAAILLWRAHEATTFSPDPLNE